MHQMLAVHLAWQQLLWHLPLTLCSGTWLTSRAAVADPAPVTDHHDQLAVPPAVAAKVEPALFA